MTQITFTNGTTVICHHATVECVPQRWQGTNKFIDVCYLRLHFTVKVSQLHLYSDVKKLEGINVDSL